MIYESYPWKQDLYKRKYLIKKYNNSASFSRDFDHTYTIIEKAIFYSAFIIRKLIDCKSKVSDDVDNYRFTVTYLKPLKEINMLHCYLDMDTHDWSHPSTAIKSGKTICNWLIHSYIFCFGYNSDKIVDSFYVSSDYDRNKCLYRISLDDWINYMDFVASDYVIATSTKSNDEIQDYIYLKKERGKL